MSAKYVFYLAVLPSYRDNCMKLISERFGSDLALFASPAHLDVSVKTGLTSTPVQLVRMVRFRGRAFLQLGGWREAFRADTVVLDLNPRSLTAWALLILRRLTGRRTLLWGHAFPQRGAESSTAGLRKMMRAWSSGTICYTHRDARKLQEAGSKTVWVAPNAIYRQAEIEAARSASPRTTVLYVGRFSPEKKVDLLVEAFALACQREPALRLTLVGGGEREDDLRDLVGRLGLVDKVDFAGWIDDADKLRSYYTEAICSASPGFAGLGLTQSLGFGVRQLVAESEPHSPEIELAETGGVLWFESDSPEELSQAILAAHQTSSDLPQSAWSNHVSKFYSAEAMAAGLASALERSQ